MRLSGGVSTQREVYVCKGKQSVSFILTSGIFFFWGLCCNGGLRGWACACPAGVVALAVGALRFVDGASLSYRARVIVRACVIVSGVGPSTASASGLPCASHRSVAPVLAPEALWGSCIRD